MPAVDPTNTPSRAGGRHGLGSPRLTADDVQRLARERTGPELAKLAEQVAHTGGCEHPVRLRASGASSPSRGEPDGVLLVACKQRRETRCRPCSVTYRADAKQIVRCGIEGGKEVPDSVSSHPSVFLTLTAPSFGAVHRAADGPCHAGPPGRCPHGRPRHCLRRHGGDGELVGSAICPDCYDYEAAVVFNATAGELWRRVTIYAKRHLAYATGMTETAMARLVRLSYVKVAELQRRGVVHLHAIVRADGLSEDGTIVAPPEWVTPQLVTEAFVRAARAVAVTREIGERSIELRWGEQVRTEHLDASAMAGLAGYLSKYLVKDASGTGALDHRLREGEIELLEVTDHLRRILEVAWRLGEDPELIRYRRWAHALGFTGHVMTKSRRYSTTFVALRRIRKAWRIAAAGEETENSSEDLEWVFCGSGHRREIDAVLARTYWQGRARSRAEYWARRHEGEVAA